MHLIYSKDGSPVDGLAGHFRNPEYFRACEKGATQVSIAEGFAFVGDAYRAQGVAVQVLGKHAGKGKGKGDEAHVG